MQDPWLRRRSPQSAFASSAAIDFFSVSPTERPASRAPLKTISVLCQEKGISEATFYAWRKQFHDTSIKEMQNLKELEKENARLKKLLAERDLENDVLKVMLTKTGKHSLEAELRVTGLSLR